MMHNAGKGLQAGKLLQQLTPDGKLYMAEKAVQNLNGKLRSRKSPKARHAEDAALNDIIDVRDTALQTISDIFDALVADKERTDHGVPVEDWAKEMMRLSAEAGRKVNHAQEAGGKPSASFLMSGVPGCRSCHTRT